jgi:signal transduction histidine kinase
MSFSDFITFCGLTRDTILGLNGFLSLIMAVVLLWLHYRVLREQRWTLAFGWAYAVFAFQYLVPWLVNLGTQFAHMSGIRVSAQASDRFADFFQDLGSMVNNILFFIAAAALLGLYERLKYIVIGVSMVILGLTFVDLGDWSQIPDKTVAFLCLSLLGWGLYANIRVLLSRVLAGLLLTGVWLYAGLNLLYSMVPFIAHSAFALNTTLSSKVAKIDQIMSLSLTVVHSYHATVLVVAIFAKVILFAAGLVLMIRSIVILHPDAYRKTLHSVTDGHREFLSSYGIVYAIARNFAADFAEVCIRVPGLERKRVAWWRWLQRNPGHVRRWRLRHRPESDSAVDNDWASFEITPLPLADASIVGKTFATGKRTVSADRESDPTVRAMYRENVAGMKALVTVPIRYHRAVIGVLNLEWRQPRTFNETIVLQIERLAAFLAPVLQSERQLSAVDQVAYRLPRLEVDERDRTGHVARRVQVVHDTLMPLATGVAIDLGFRQIFAACNDTVVTTDQPVTEGNVEEILVQKVTELAGRRADEMRITKERLIVRDTRLGSLRMALLARNSEGLDIERPMLGENYLHRRTIGALVAAALFDSINVQLVAALNQLHLELHSSNVDSIEKWLDVIDKNLKSVGVPWTVAVSGGSRRLLGRQAAVAIVEASIRRDGEDRLLGTKPIVITLGSLQEKAFHILVLPVSIPAAGGYLFLGVARKGFGSEVNLWPWNEFMERLQEGAGAALLRINSVREFQRLTLEQARTQGTLTTLVAMSAMSRSHEVGSLARGIGTVADNLLDGLRVGKLTAEPDIVQNIEELKESAQELQKLIEPLPKMRGHQVRPCDLRDVVDYAVDLYKLQSQQKRVAIAMPKFGDVSVPIDVPNDVAKMALTNLISNALDAVSDGGKIEIEVQVDAAVGSVRCHVCDDGKGVPERIMKAGPFEPFVSSREGGGLGLYLTRQSLLENQADVEVTKPGPGGTIFTLSFRSARGSSVTRQEAS